MILAIIVGHDKLKQGARGVSPLGLSEYMYNEGVAQEMFRVARDNGLTAAVFHRDGLSIDGVARFVNKWAQGPKACAIELHFNSFNAKARGTETLYDADPPEGKILAEILQRNMCDVFARKGKDDRGIKGLAPEDRGHRSLSGIYVPACIVEPAFGDNPTDAKLLAENAKPYAACLVAGAIEFLTKHM